MILDSDEIHISHRLYPQFACSFNRQFIQLKNDRNSHIQNNIKYFLMIGIQIAVDYNERHARVRRIFKKKSWRNEEGGRREMSKIKKKRIDWEYKIYPHHWITEIQIVCEFSLCPPSFIQIWSLAMLDHRSILTHQSLHLHQSNNFRFTVW